MIPAAGTTPAVVAVAATIGRNFREAVSQIKGAFNGALFLPGAMHRHGHPGAVDPAAAIVTTDPGEWADAMEQSLQIEKEMGALRR